jgi:Outer membrane protein Omp28/Secretion system C-terminal sorting domain
MKKALLSFSFFLMIFLFMGSSNLSAQTLKNPLLEFCTGTWCQWCPCGDITIENLLAAHPNLIPLAYHGPAGQDPYSIFPGNEIIGMMGFSGYPTATVNRVSALGDYTTWTSKVNAQVNDSATVSIDIQRSFNETTGELNATVEVTALENLTGQFKYNIVLTEDSLIYNQVNNGNCVSGGQNWQHDWVVRAMVNGAAGENLNAGSTWNTGDMISKNVTYSVPLTYNFDKCNLVVFVYKQNSPMYLAELQQAEQITLVSPDYVATIAFSSSDVISQPNSSAEFSVTLRNDGLMDDTYDISASLNGPGGWTGEYTTSNGTFNFGETDAVFIASGDSASVSVSVNPNGIQGSGETELQFSSQTDPGTMAIAHLKNVTTTGVNYLVIDASGSGYGDIANNSLESLNFQTHAVVSSSALEDPNVDLSNFYCIVWSAGIHTPVLTTNSLAALQGYLDQGGRLFIEGQNFGEDIFETTGQSQFAQDFFHNYLHAEYNGPNGFSFLIKGIAGDVIGDGMQFVLNDVYLRNPDWIAPLDANANSIFQYLNGPNIAGIRTEINDYRIVYTAFGIEQITDQAIADTLMSRAINWLMDGIVITGTEQQPIVNTFSLNQNYPNPFNPSTTINYTIIENANVSLKVYNVMGQEVAQLVNQKQSAGVYNIQFDASALASGIYFYKLTAGDFVAVKKMTLLK